MAVATRRRLIAPLAAAALGLALLGGIPVAQGHEAPPGGAEQDAQYPFACTAQDHELELVVDNQDGCRLRGPAASGVALRCRFP